MLNTDLVSGWIRRLHGNSAGKIHVCSDLSWSGRLFDHLDTNSAVTYITELDERGAKGIYLRITSIRDDATIEPGKERGGADISATLPALWADIDLEGPGHKHQPNRPDLPGYDPRKRIVHPLPTSEQQVHQILTEAGIPQPSFWIHSGGGLYPMWMLETPRDLTQDPMELAAVATLSANWQLMIHDTFERCDLHYGSGIGDLARVLRIPGTTNGKVPGQPTYCRPYQQFGDNGPLYGLEVLEEALCELQPSLRDAAAESRKRWEQRIPAREVVASAPPSPPREYRIEDSTPLNDYEREVGWDSLLGQAGWRVHHTGQDGTVYWTRPGKDPRDGWSATTNNAADRDRMYCFSDAAGLPVNEPMTRAFVYAQLHHAGDMSAAAAALRQRGFGAGGEDGWTPPTNPGEWIHIPGGQTAEEPSAEPVDQPPLHDVTQDQGLPQFPVDCMPPVLRNMITSVTGNLQTPVDASALMALSSVSALVGDKFMVEFHQVGWREAPLLYTMCPMAPSERKSPIADAFREALLRRQRVDAAKFRARIQAEIDELDQQRGSNELKGNPAGANRLEDQIKTLEQSLHNPPSLFLDSDTTAEALAVGLAENGGSGAVLDGEGSIIGSLMLGRYSQGSPNLDLLIAGYEGRHFSSRRKGSGRVAVDRACITLGLMTQPEQWMKLATSEHVVGRGLLARMLLANPSSRVGSRDLRTVRPQDRMAQSDWQHLVNDLADIPKPTVGPDGDIQIPTIILSDTASELMYDYYLSHEARLGELGDLSSPGIREWAGKHCGRILRIAGILHLAAGYRQDTELSEQILRCAISIGEWSIIHAKSLLTQEAEDRDVATRDQVNRVIGAIRRLAAKNPEAIRRHGVSIRELSRAIHAPWARQAVISEALDQLQEAGIIRETSVPDIQGKPRRRFQISPVQLAHWGL